jgi:hypothetical protein
VFQFSVALKNFLKSLCHCSGTRAENRKEEERLNMHGNPRFLTGEVEQCQS